ncbi:MAG TPA: acyltransferase [Thermodesulfobacteriota bacterium]|mgnify:CR=1 FL=1|nr:acyltransferase [Deltaproteobacteria bacterium]HNR12655.1 acyltransferase [Thermodesulfobacteriota bacterium]HNU70316.1 acyltransferase [Thermodesulfobacteriota bacterium]HQO78550.1 acyltransferase [Thermodesulfobacteriota bacterium]
MKTLLVKLLRTLTDWLYPKCRGINPLHILYIAFISQKLLRINGSVPWPVHFTSRILYHRNIQIGNRTAPGFNAHCYIQARNGIRIGHNVRIGPGVGLVSANHNRDDYDTWDAAGPIEIGDNVWIGMNSVLLPGVKIGSNVVIGANSVVNCDIPPNSIAIGNPCRIVNVKPPYKGFDYSTFR